MQRRQNGYLETLVKRFEVFFKKDSSSLLKTNEYGHTVFTITGSDFFGYEEIKELNSAGYRVGYYAKQVLSSIGPNGYNARHRLTAGQKYMIVIMPASCIADNAKRTTENLCAEAEKFNYGRPLAGFIPRVREIVSDRWMEEKEFWCIAALHEPLAGDRGDLFVLGVRRNAGGYLVAACDDNPGRRWGINNAFVFLAGKQVQ